MDSPWSDLDRPPLRERALRTAVLEPGGLWRRLDVLAQVGSTNADLVARAAAGEPEGSVLVAEHQSQGRGRLTRQWEAPARSSMIVSVLVRPTGRARDHLAWLPLLTGVAVVEALTRRCGVAARLKWPNDVLVPVHEQGAAAAQAEHRKVCGILAEATSTPDGPAVVVGVGLNVTQRQDELPVPTATSLLLAGAAVTDRDTILRAYLRAFAARYLAWQEAGGDVRASGLRAEYLEACSTLGAAVQVHLPDGSTLTGTAQEVDDDGRLVVLDGGGALHRLAAGDVVHVRPAGNVTG